MGQNTNPFGGKNPNSLYVPISETEQEVLERLVNSDDLEVHVVGWGVANKPSIIFGDLRVSIQFRINFDKPEVYVPLHYVDLELRTRSGILVFGPSRYPTLVGNQPLLVKAGMFLDYAWDIAIKEMHPEFVRAIKPGARGLTSRHGNMDLTDNQRSMLDQIERGDQKVRALNAQEAVEATAKSKGR